jgi:hypothetical protein
MQQLTQDITKLNQHKTKLKEEIALLKAGAEALKIAYNVSEVSLCVVHSLEGLWTSVELKEAIKQSTLFF